MRIGLVACFDVGATYGLDDKAFLDKQVGPGWSTGDVGVKCPLGNGVDLDLATDPELLAAWQTEAVKQMARSETETGRSDDSKLSQSEHDRQVVEAIEATPIAEGLLTIYSIGVAFVQIRFDRDIVDDITAGLLSCYEFAGYRPAIAQGLQAAAIRRIESAIPQLATPLSALTARKLPGIHLDKHKYEEQGLIPYFYTVVELTAEGDRGRIDEVKKSVAPSCEEFDFAYHGRLHLGESALILESRTLVNKPKKGAFNRAESEIEIVRMLADIQIGMVVESGLKAIDSVLSQEIGTQVDSYLGHKAEGRNLQDLNRLRLLGLAVVRVSDPSAIVPTTEDRKFLKQFLRDAEEDRSRVSAACELVYSVQATETEMRVARRQSALNAIVLLLAAITVLSVMTDAYDFIRDEAALVSDRVARVRLLIIVLLALGLLIAGLVYFARPGHRKTPARNSEDWTDDHYVDPIRGVDPGRDAHREGAP